MLSRVAKNIRFIRDGIRFSRFIKSNTIELRPCMGKNKKLIVVVQPWLGTAVPWFAITTALMLMRRGKNVELLFDDLPFGDDQSFFKVQSRVIAVVLNQMSGVSYKRLSEYRSIRSVDIVLINKLAKLNSIHNTKGESNVSQRQNYEAVIVRQLESVYRCYDEFLQSECVDQIFVPGGIWGSSGVVGSLVDKYRVQSITYDSGEGLFLLSLNGVAARLTDVPLTFEQINMSKQERQFAIEQGKLQLEKRRAGNDIYEHFKTPGDFSELNDEYYLLLLNSVWDSAALGLHTVYESTIEWIFDSIKWVLDNSSSTIVIRQHPAERNVSINNTDNYADKISKFYKGNDRVVFIPAESDINSYDLMERAKCILGFSSTSIVESVALGKRAIVVSNAYYSDLGVVYKAENTSNYYDLLTSVENGELVISEEMQNRAYICNYISQATNWIKTKFTPNRNDFEKWSLESLNDLLIDQVLIESIESNTPSSLITHRKKMHEGLGKESV